MSSALPPLAIAVGPVPRREAARVSQDAPEGAAWCLQRNCSMAPSTLLSLYAVLCAVSLGIAAFFWTHGAPLVLPFALVELLAVGVALAVYARHAVDGERVRLDGGRLVVVRRAGPREDRFEFDAHWVRVSRAADGGVQVSAGAQALRIGGLAAPAQRDRVTREINEALARFRHGAAGRA
jgi:uncharacterized membrane protein